MILMMHMMILKIIRNTGMIIDVSDVFHDYFSENYREYCSTSYSNQM